jgi:hypothetical protein
MAIDTNPLVSFSYRFFEIPTYVIPNCTAFQSIDFINNTYVCVDIPIPPPTIIETVIQNVTIIRKTFGLSHPTYPLYGSIVIMGLIVGGSILYIAMDYVIARRRKEKEDKKVAITNLTDFELRPIE